MSLENLKSIFSNTKKFEAAKPKPTQEPKKIVENKGLPVSPDVQKFGSVDLGAMSSQFAIQKEPQRIDFISNTNAEGFVPNSTDKKNSFYKKGTSDFENIQSFGDTPQKTTLEPNSFFQSDLTTLDIGNPNSFISSDITSFDIPNLDSFIQTDVTINAKDSTKFVQTDVTINAKNPTEFVQTDVTTNTQEPNQFNLSDLTLMGTQDVSAFTISDLTLMQTQEPNKFNLSDLTTLNIGDISLFKISDVTTMNIPETSEFVQSDVTTNTQEPNEFPQSDVTINTQEPNEFVQSDVTVNTQEPNEFVQSDVTVNAQDSTEFVQTDVTVNAQDSTEFVQSDVTVNAQDPTEFAQSDVTVNAQDSTEFVQTDVTTNTQEPNQFNLSDLTTLVDDSIYNIDDGPQEVNLFGDTHATGFTAGLLEGSDSLYVGDTSIFRIESEPQEVNLVDIDNKHAFGFTAGLLEGSDSQFVGIDDTGFTNTGILGLMTDNGVVDFFDDTDATGFTLNQFHKAPTLFVGATESTGGGTYENTGTLGTLGMVDFFNNTGAEGFTDMTDGVSEFKNIGDDNTFTKPDGITFDTHNIPHDVNNITFTNQTSNGLNFIDTDGVHSNGFTVGLTDTSDSQFVGVDETTPSFENTGNYYDSIHTRNPISDSIFGPVDFMSGVTSYYPTLESPIPGFTNDFGVGEESLPGYNAQAGALGISRFFRKDDGSGEIQTGLENIYLGTGTHTMWGGSLTLADQIETGLSFLNKSSIFGDDPSTNDIEETDFALPYATGFTPGLSEIDYLNSQFEGVDEEAGTYTPRTSFQGGYVINTDNIDLSVDIPEDGGRQLFELCPVQTCDNFKIGSEAVWEKTN